MLLGKWCNFYNKIVNYYNNKDITLILFSNAIFGDSIEHIDKNIFLIGKFNWKMVNKLIGYNVIKLDEDGEMNSHDFSDNRRHHGQIRRIKWMR